MPRLVTVGLGVWVLETKVISYCKKKKKENFFVDTYCTPGFFNSSFCFSFVFPSQSHSQREKKRFKFDKVFTAKNGTKKLSKNENQKRTLDITQASPANSQLEIIPHFKNWPRTFHTYFLVSHFQKSTTEYKQKEVHELSAKQSKSTNTIEIAKVQLISTKQH